jgi:hypothetical protein
MSNTQYSSDLIKIMLMISAIKTLLQTLVLLINKEESQINLKFAMDEQVHSQRWHINL